MQPLNERYIAYCNEYQAKIDKRLAEAGLPGIGKNHLRYYFLEKIPPMTFEDFAGISDEGMHGLADNSTKIVKRQSIRQSKIARKPRIKVGDDGKTISQIIGWLAMSPDHEDESPKELWDPFLSELERQGINPKEISTPSGDFKKLKCEYDFKQGRRPISGGQFAKVVSAFRTGKKNYLSRG